MATEERVSRLEGAYEHMATKADLATLKGEMLAGFSEVRRDMAELKASVARIEEALQHLRPAPIGEETARALYEWFERKKAARREGRPFDEPMPHLRPGLTID